ncbi:class I SAM-dependent methyltransferase [Sporomusa acidovorans]|uniref:S-adenosyl-L-methionine-dependent methyltransferase n=1 Tax=Sporomusa acidovorans (strain ATCC 49682 / DSM 3132 / Mol) TaxID=1123286 RepID=A0ABZ3JAC0_SPOA4|nr:SAM-dependent methyltransferase [Sporomusa acidovorans]OZC16161.1 putative S-adenosyl-L-methionine-dependent methyltransferase [Sporomusa acidovorans DSM 3132]SDE29526.1 methyltransferase, TIGR00027 family [Sporomusa acidovorans]
MANKKNGQTAFNVAAARLIEQYQYKEIRLFTDPVIKNFFNWPIRFLMKFKIIRDWIIRFSDNKTKGIFGSQICRTKYIDDSLQAAIENGIGQVVILGAGLDTRPYRLPGRGQIKFFEVDMPSIQEYKKKKVENYLGSLPGNVVFIPIDFNIQTLDEVFTGKGLDFSKPVVYIWEGVTPYITEEAVSNTLRFISRSSPGSIVVFTYILKSVVEKNSDIEGANELVKYLEKYGIIWHFGLDPLQVEDFLQQFNLNLVEDMGASFYQEQYLKPLGRRLEVSEIERIAYARVI